MTHQIDVGYSCCIISKNLSLNGSDEPLKSFSQKRTTKVRCFLIPQNICETFFHLVLSSCLLRTFAFVSKAGAKIRMISTRPNLIAKNFQKKSLTVDYQRDKFYPSSEPPANSLRNRPISCTSLPISSSLVPS